MKNLTFQALLFVFMFPLTAFSQDLTFAGIEEVKALKRGKEYNIKWIGGTKDKMIKIELHNLTGKVQNWDGLQNDGSQVVKLKSGLKPGKNYTFKILTDDGEFVSSQNVRIKRRTPLALKLIAPTIFPIVLLIFREDNASMIEAAPSSPSGN